MSVLKVGAPQKVTSLNPPTYVVTNLGKTSTPLDDESYSRFSALKSVFAPNAKAWDPSISLLNTRIIEVGYDYTPSADQRMSYRNPFGDHEIYLAYPDSNVAFFIMKTRGSDDLGGYTQNWSQDYIVDLVAHTKYSCDLQR